MRPGDSANSHSFRPPAAVRAARAYVAAALPWILLFAASSAALAGPVVPGLVSSQLSPRLKGLVLIEELNCAACHGAGRSLAARSKIAPRLAEVSSRVNPSWLADFIRQPHRVKPGSTMPDVLSHLDDESKEEAASALAHFLLSRNEASFSPQPPDAVAAGQGRTLFHSRGCAACHFPRDADGRELPGPVSAPLGDLAKKYSFKSLVDFLRLPHTSRPSGRMPDLRLSNRDLDCISHFLLQDTQVPGALAFTLYRGQVWEGIGGENVKAVRAGHTKDFALDSLGKPEHHTAVKYEGWLQISNAGRYSFFAALNGGSLSIDGKQIITLEPSDRRGVKQLEGVVDLDAGWRKVDAVYFHTGREPKFSLEMLGPQFPRGPIPSSMLSISDKPIPAFTPFKVEPALAARGREHFANLGCANCHDDLGVPSKSAPALASLNGGRGCLGEATGPWPRFSLTPEQRVWIAEALPHAEQPGLDAHQQVNKALVTFNCLACHDRAGLGGIDPERQAHFTGSQPAMGDQGRLPPPLSHVGAKLSPGWMADVLLRGKRQRAYLDASMPQFGEANVGHLVKLFGEVDQLESAVIPAVADVPEAKAAGLEMVGATGLNCIACHELNGQKSGEIAALDLVDVASRLNKNWFHLYLRQPSRFHPNVIMPSYWPDGQSVRPSILGGDAALQIEALWLYFEDGGRAKKPAGLSRQSSEIRVGDVTEICRGQSPVAYRAIGVGYPERINLMFDAGEMALRQLWKGEFATVDFGHFRPRGGELFSFPAGIPFHRLRSLDENWPSKGKANHSFPQDHGYQFRGYHLDAARRPTFLYRYGVVAVEDFFEDVRGQDGKVFLRRTLRFDTSAAPEPFYFRAAAGRNVAAQSTLSFTIDKLQIRLASGHEGIVRGGDTAELLIPLSLPEGRSTLSLEYQW